MSTQLTRVGWRHSTNIYEVNLRQYTPEGTINAFAAHLPRLRQMGVETLWFMPITPISKERMKGTLGSYYACSDYTSISSEFGTHDDFKRLVRQAHDLGFKIIIDWVANHTGWDHVWTKSHPEYFEMDAQTGTFKVASGMDDIIELDFKNPKLVEAMIAAMQFWIREFDLDGFRCDLAFWVELDFWKKARPALDALKPLFWLGELDELEHPEYMEVFDASYTWTWMHKTEDFYKKHLPISALDAVLQRYSTATNGISIPAWFTTNHDENSWNGTEFEKYGDMVNALAVFSFTWNGMPLLYSGQELPNLKRLKFFDRDPIDWNGDLKLACFYQKLLTLHTKHPALRAADEAVTTFRLQTEANERVFAFLRKNGDHQVLVLLNLSAGEPVRFHIREQAPAGDFIELFSEKMAKLDGFSEYLLSAWDYQVYYTKV
jgi:glycosidase